MPDVDLPFGRQEYADRLARVRASMEVRGIEVLVAADPWPIPSSKPAS